MSRLPGKLQHQASGKAQDLDRARPKPANQQDSGTQDQDRADEHTDLARKKVSHQQREKQIPQHAMGGLDRHQQEPHEQCPANHPCPLMLYTKNV